MTDPVRMKDDASVPDDLRGLLDGVRGVEPASDAAQRIEKAMTPLLGAGGATGGAAGGAGAASSSTILSKPLIAALLMSVAAGGGVGLYWSMSEAPAPEPVAPPAERPEAIETTTESEPPIEYAPTGARDEPEAAPEDPRGERTSRSRDRETGLSEAELLRGAQDAVHTNPRRALRLVREHARRYPDGFMVQEREVIAIDALKRLGQRRKAATRASRFLSRFPSSAHRARIAELVDAGT